MIRRTLVRRPLADRWPAVARVATVLLVAVATAAAGQTVEGTADRPLRFLGNAALPPMVFLDKGNAVGVAVDLAREAARRAGIPASIEAVDWPDAQTQVATGKADALVQINPTPARARLFDFSEPLLDSHFHILRRLDRTDLKDLASLRGHKVGVAPGSYPAQILAADEAIVRVDVTGGRTAFEMIAAGTLDAYVVDRWVGEYELAALKVAGIVIVEPPVASSQSRIAVRKGNRELLDRINTGLRMIVADGTRQAILDRWQAKEVVYVTREELDVWTQFGLAAGALLLVTLTAFALAYARSVRRKNRDLEAARSRIQDLYDHAPCGYHSIDAAGTFIEVNATELEWLGCTREDLIDRRSPRDFLAASSRKVFDDGFEQLRRGGSVESVLLELCVDGQPTRWVRAAATAVCDASGRFQSSRAVWHDVTEVRRHAAAVREAELALQATRLEAARLEAAQRFRAIAEQGIAGVSEADTTGRYIFVSDWLCTFLGRRREELIGQPITDFTHPGDRAESIRQIDAALRTGRGFNVEKRYLRADGAIVWGHVAVAAIRDADGRPTSFVALVIDITDRKRGEEELATLATTLEQRVAQRTAELTAASVAKTEFLAHMSHEIRTPMNAVLGLTQVLEREPLTEEQGEVVHTINEAGRSLLRIINDILDFSKIEAGQLRLDRQPFEVPLVLHRVDALLRGTAETKGLGWSIVPPREALGPLLGDALRLEQVLVNLVGNAIKFTEKGDVTLEVSARHEVANFVGLHCEVRDTGIGIAPEAIGTLFAPFTQASAGVTRRFGGTGLGLSICKRVVEMMGGRLGVSSSVGVGSRFWFEIPLEKAAPTTAGARTRAPEVAVGGPRLAGLRVLAVDDTPMNLFVVERILRREGAVVELAADGEQALQILRSRPDAFDVVLMDIQMPVMDGLTATRAIRADPALAALPVIALTAGVLAEERERALAAGVNDFLAKPLDLQRVVRVLAGIREACVRLN